MKISNILQLSMKGKIIAWAVGVTILVGSSVGGYAVYKNNVNKPDIPVSGAIYSSQTAVNTETGVIAGATTVPAVVDNITAGTDKAEQVKSATTSATPSPIAPIVTPKSTPAPTPKVTPVPTPAKPKAPTNNEKLVNFFASKGIIIPLNDEYWQFFTTSNPQSFGGPSGWGDNPVIAANKYGKKDGILVEEGLKYMYCPALNKGAKIIEVNHYFKVEKLY